MSFWYGCCDEICLGRTSAAGGRSVVIAAGIAGDSGCALQCTAEVNEVGLDCRGTDYSMRCTAAVPGARAR